MASWKFLAPGVFLCVASTAFLFMSLGTDEWFVLDASDYRRLCPEEDIFAYILPPEVLEPTIATNSGENEPPYSDSRKVTSTQKIEEIPEIERRRLSRVDRPASDSPGLPLLSRRVNAKPAPLLERVHGAKKIRSKDPRTGHTRVRRGATDDTKWPRNPDGYYAKVKAWNRFTRDMEINLLQFGGRDVTARDQGIGIKPIGTRNNECVDQVRKSMKKSNGTSKCPRNQTFEPEQANDPLRFKCARRQFSTSTGLWRTCLSSMVGTFLFEMIERGDVMRCAPVRYGDIRTDMLPASLTSGEAKDVYSEEWKTLHLRRILTSFLCMAAPVQVFGLMLIFAGWKSRKGFLVYAGGLVLVMSGIFQLLAAGTALLLFDAEMRRSPADLYGFPKEVKDRFGRSAQASWVATGCAILGGIICAFMPTVVYNKRRTPQSHVNGVQSPFHCPTPSPIANDANFYPVPSPAIGSAAKSENGLESLGVQKTPEKKLQKQSFSVDAAAHRMIDDFPSIGLVLNDTPRIAKKTKSAPNLQSASLKMSHGRTKRGRSGRRSHRTRSQRTLSPVAVVRTPQAAVLALEEEQKSKQTTDMVGGASPDSDRVFDDSNTRHFSESVDDRLFAVGSARPVTERLPYSRSLVTPRHLYNGKVGRAALASVDISQRMRHARYARRTFHSCDESAIRQLIEAGGRQVSPTTLAELRTRSLPRRSMRHTPLSEIAGIGGENALREHCTEFLQRNNRAGLASCEGGGGGGGSLRKPLQLSQLGRQHSDDPRLRMRPMHPAVARWLQDGGRWSKSLDEGKNGDKEYGLPYQKPLIAREGTLDSVEECLEVGEVPEEPPEECLPEACAD